MRDSSFTKNFFLFQLTDLARIIESGGYLLDIFINLEQSVFGIFIDGNHIEARQ